MSALVLRIKFPAQVRPCVSVCDGPVQKGSEVQPCCPRFSFQLRYLTLFILLTGKPKFSPCLFCISIQYPLIYKTLRVDANFTTKEAVRFIADTVNVTSLLVGTEGLYIPDEKRWLDDEVILSTYDSLQDVVRYQFLPSFTLRLLGDDKTMRRLDGSILFGSSTPVGSLVNGVHGIGAFQTSRDSKFALPRLYRALLQLRTCVRLLAGEVPGSMATRTPR